MLFLLLVAATSNRESREAKHQAKIAALTDTSKPFNFEGPDGDKFAAIEKKLKEMEADSTAQMDAFKHPQHANTQTSLMQTGAHSSLSAIQLSLKEIQARAQTQLDALRKKHHKGLPGDPDAAEDQLFQQLSQEESKSYSDMYQKLGHLQGKVAAKVKALKDGATSLIEDGKDQAAVKDATDHFSGLFKELKALKTGADAEISKLTHKIIAEPSSMMQRSEIQYRTNFEDLTAKLDELKQYTKSQQRELEEDDAMKAMNAGPESLLQAAAKPSSLLEDPALAKRIVNDFDGANDEFTTKMAELQQKTNKELLKLKTEEDSPAPGAIEPVSLLETSPAIQKAFRAESPEFKTKMAKLQATTEANLKQLVLLEKVPEPFEPSSFLQTDPKWAAEHNKLVSIIQKLKHLKEGTTAKIDRIRESAGLPSSFLEAAMADPIDPNLDAKLKKIQAETTARIAALRAKTEAIEKKFKSSFLETGGNGKAPKIPIVDLDAEVHSIESKSREQLEAIMGDKSLFQGHDLDSSFLESGRLVKARKLRDEPKDGKDSKKEEDAGDEFDREMEGEPADEEGPKKPGVESAEYAEVQRKLKESMNQLRKGLSHYGEGIFGDKKDDKKEGEDADKDAEKDADKDADKDAEEAPKAESLLQRKGRVSDFLREPRLLLEKSDEAATKAATAGLEKQFHDAFRQGFAQGLRDAGAHPIAPTTSFIEAPDPNDPPMFAELDKVQGELRNLKSDVAASFDKVGQLVNADGSLAQMRSD